MFRTIGTVEERRTYEAVDSLDRRLEPHRQYVEVDFGSTPTTSATARVSGLNWLTYDHCPTFGLTSQAQAAANLRVAVTAIEPGKALVLAAASSTNLSGVQRLSMVVL